MAQWSFFFFFLHILLVDYVCTFVCVLSCVLVLRVTAAGAEEKFTAVGLPQIKKVGQIVLSLRLRHILILSLSVSLCKCVCVCVKERRRFTVFVTLL